MNMTRKQLDIIDLVKLGVLLTAITIIYCYLISPIVSNASKEGFKESVMKYANSAEADYLSEYSTNLDNMKEETCTNIKDKINDGNNSEGIIVVKKGQTDRVIDTFVYVSNGKYVFNSKGPLKTIKKNDILDAKYSKPYYRNCKSYEEGKIY